MAAYLEEEVWKENKKQVLALLQYIMEKDMNFSSAVFHEDVEYEQGPAGDAPQAQDLSLEGKKELHDQEWDD